MELKSITYKELQSLEMFILRQIDTATKQCGIPYYLRDGSLLGAIRHSGFIPWDTDIDIEIPVSHYAAFYHCIAGNEDLEVFYYQKTYVESFIRIGLKGLGDGLIHVDVFPSLGAGVRRKNAVKLMRRISFWALLRKVKVKKISSVKSFKKKLLIPLILLLKCIFVFISLCYIKNKIHKLFFKYDFTSSVYVLNPFCVYKEKSIFRKHYYDKTVSGCFEGLATNIPFAYDAMLRSVYGDYLTLPKGKEHFDPRSVATQIPTGIYNKFRCGK